MPLLHLRAATTLTVLLGVHRLLGAAETSPHYNVLFLMTDEHNPTVLGCAGDPVIQTPTLDALAASGVRMTASYCQNPICVPSRSSLVSGRMPSNIHVFGNGAEAQYQGITTMADVFVQAGYRVAWLGKTHWGNPRFPKDNDEGADQRNVAGETGRGETAPPAAGLCRLFVERGTKPRTRHRECGATLPRKKSRSTVLPRGFFQQATFPLHDSGKVL